MPNEEYIYHIQLKNSNNEPLYPVTLWRLILDKPSLQTQLTNINAGTGIDISIVDNIVKISTNSILPSNAYGTELPTTGVEGQIFYQLEDEEDSEEEP